MEQRNEPPTYLREVPPPEVDGHSPAPHPPSRGRRLLALALVGVAAGCYGIFVERMWGPGAVLAYTGTICLFAALFVMPTRRRPKG